MPAAAEKHVHSFTITVNGTKLDPELMAGLLEVRVRQALRMPCSALVKIGDPKIEKMDTHPMQVGASMVISLGALDESAANVVFKGEIVALEPEFEKTGATIAIRAYDKLHRLTHGKKVRTFQQVSASDMVTKVMGEAGLSGSTTSTNVIFPFFQQSDETDRDFIRRLELIHDYELVMEDEKYEFRPSTKVADPAATLKFGESLLNFRPRLTAAHQDSTVAVRGWSVDDKAVVSASASNAEDPVSIGITRSSVTSLYTKDVLVSDRHAETSSEADALAKSTLARRAATFLEAEGSTFGNPAIKAGSTIQIDGIGSKFSGKYPVSAVTHSMRAGVFKTHFQISGRSDRGLLDLMHPPQERNWSQAMVIGVVTNINDPDALGRVRVKFPQLSDSEESWWARVLSHNQGNARGIFMLPQVDDEVVVAFENGDPRRPLVIGSLFNGKNKPGSEMLPDQKGGFTVLSDDRAYVHSKEDMTFKSDKALHIEVTNDADTKIKGSSKGKVDSAVEMKAGTSYTLEAGSSMTIKGATISVESQGSLKLKGATVEIESQGPATLKGAMIDINASGIANLKGSMVNIG